jgi:YVTN family beta-propeller protein
MGTADTRRRGGRIVLPLALGIAALLALGPVAASGATVSAAWSAKIGSAGVNGKAAISAYTTGTGAITLKLAKLRASTLLPVVLHKGTCSSVGAVLLKLPSIKTTRTGTAARTSSLTAAQVSKITAATTAGTIAIRIGTGSARKCGAFSQLAISPVVAATITVGEGPIDVAIAPNGVWVTNWDDNTLSRIDPATSKVVQTLPLTLPGEAGPEAIAFGDGSLWVTTTEWDYNDDWDEIPLAGSLVRVNPTTGQQQATVPIGRGALDVEVSPGAVWVTAYDDKSVLRIDTATNTVAATIPVPDAPLGVAFGAGSLWVSSEDGTVARIDPATNSIVATISTQDTGGFVAFGGGAVWVTNPGDQKGRLTRIDPVTNGVIASIVVGSDPWTLAYASGSVWVGLDSNWAVVRVSATTNAILNRVTLDHPIKSIAATGHAVWAVHRCHDVVTRIAY